MKFPAIFLLFLVCATPSIAQHVISYQDTNFIYNLSVDSILSGDSVNYDCTIRSIAIIRKADNKIIQIIQPEENGAGCGLPKDQLFIIEDINFDALSDIRLLQFLPAAPNLPYFYWTYDRKTGKFHRNKALEAITSPTFDHSKKLILSFWRASCCDHGLSTYRYINGNPVLIEETETAMDLDDNSKYITTIKKRLNGQMRLIKRTIEKESNN